MNDQLAMMVCAACGTTNRVPTDKLARGLRPICGRCKQPLGATLKPVILTDLTYHSFVSQPTPALVDLWAPWCGPCRMIAPILEQLAHDLAGRVRIAKLNVDENPQTSSHLRVASIPMLLIYQNGQEVDRIVGAVPKTEILRHLQPYL